MFINSVLLYIGANQHYVVKLVDIVANLDMVYARKIGRAKIVNRACPGQGTFKRPQQNMTDRRFIGDSYIYIIRNIYQLNDTVIVVRHVENLPRMCRIGWKYLCFTWTLVSWLLPCQSTSDRRNVTSSLIISFWRRCSSDKSSPTQ